MTDTGFDGVPALTGNVTNVALIDPDGTPNKVLDVDLAFSVKVNWTVTPPATAQLLDGTWTIRAYAESMGPGPEAIIGTATVAANGGNAYSASITVPAGTLPADVAPDSGVYKLVVVITYRTQNNVLTEIAAFSEGTYFLLRKP